jgi:hypothetical protein
MLKMLVLYILKFNKLGALKQIFEEMQQIKKTVKLHGGPEGACIGLKEAHCGGWGEKGAAVDLEAVRCLCEVRKTQLMHIINQLSDPKYNNCYYAKLSP